LLRLADAPSLCARAAADAPKIPDGATPLPSPTSGFVQFISFSELNDQLDKANATLWITTPPGRWVLKGTALGYVTGDCDPGSLIENFTLGDERTIEQDARFGMVILSEVACRALSPGVNDPGTAIDVIHRLERILWDMGQTVMDRDPDTKPEYDRIIIGTVSASDLMQDGFAALMQDGGDRFDVMAQVLKATGRLHQSDWTELANAAGKTRDSALAIVDRRIDDPEAVERLHEKAKLP
jgi:uncharacterized membrane protein